MNASEQKFPAETRATGTPKISVVVPVYNVEKYLRECVDSVLEQTFSDFELILVDDGSPDNSGKICDEYAKKDSRVRVFHKTNGGVSSARNLGLENARAEWIMFVDSDDMICADALAVLFPWTKFADVDLVEAGTTASALNAKFRGAAKLVKSDGAFDYAVNLSSFNQRDWGTAPWNKLFRRKTLLETDALGVPPEFWFGEDFLMCLRFSRKMRRAVKIGRSIYFYRRNEFSCMATRPRSTEYLFRMLDEAERTVPSGVESVWRGVWLALMEYVFAVGFLRFGGWQRTFPPAKKCVVEMSRSRRRFCRATRLALFFAERPETRVERILRKFDFSRRAIFWLWRVFRRPLKP